MADQEPEAELGTVTLVTETSNGWTIREVYPLVPQTPSLDMRFIDALASSVWLSCLPWVQRWLGDQYRQSTNRCFEMVDSESKTVVRQYFFRTAPPT